MSDTVSTYYDYTGQDGYYSIYVNSGGPVELTSINETLTLSSATTSAGTLATRQGKATSSVSTLHPSYVPLAFARSRFERTVREHMKTRMLLLSRHSIASGVHVK
jgi:hypothetical protein